MSTKNLARSVIEGGRCNGNKLERRESHRGARARLRPQLALALRDPERAEDLSFEERRAVCRCFHDKLAPADRWMRKQVGRPWSKVEGELLKRFDTRTMAGRHVVFDHMMRRQTWLDDGIWNVDCTYFFVDAKGFLRTTVPRWRTSFQRPSYAPPSALERLRAWAGERKVLLRADVRYWAEPTTPGAAPHDQRYRQAQRLSEEEMRFFDALADECRELITHRVAAPFAGVRPPKSSAP
jgi:hypothetical protein